MDYQSKHMGHELEHTFTQDVDLFHGIRLWTCSQNELYQSLNSGLDKPMVPIIEVRR